MLLSLYVLLYLKYMFGGYLIPTAVEQWILKFNWPGPLLKLNKSLFKSVSGSPGEGYQQKKTIFYINIDRYSI